MVLGKIKNVAAALLLVTGMTGAVSAQTYNNSIKTETSISNTGVTREVVRVNTPIVTANYATYPHSNKGDVLQLGVNLPKGFGVQFTKLDDNEQYIFEAWKSFDVKNTSCLRHLRRQH